MGLNIASILPRKEVTMEDLRNKKIAIDTYIMLYQFLLTLPKLTDNKGRITSHLSGLFYRTTHLMQYGIKPVFVFDGPPHPLKIHELERRKKIKEEARKKLEEAKSIIGKCGETFNVITGWIPKKYYSKLIEILKKSTQDKFVMEIVEPGHHDHPPTLIEYKGILTSFGALTKAIGVPSYEEIDPTPIMVFSFPIIFGFMFGDVGHGLIVTLVALLALHYKMKGVQFGEMLNYIVQGSPLLLLCGISSIIFGILYGEFFGSEEWFEMLFKPILHALGKEHGPLWFSPYHEPMYLLKICIFIAIAHITLGIILDLINKISNKEFKHAIAGPGTWLWLYGSGAYLFITYRSRIFEVIFRMDIMIPFIIIPFIVMLVLRILIEGASEGFGSTLESFLASISNTVSYSRILALNMAHTIFAKLPFNFAGSTIAFIGAFIGFNLLILMLESLLSFMHTLRLHWVEWFLKFYKGEGYEFKPFTLISL